MNTASDFVTTRDGTRIFTRVDGAVSPAHSVVIAHAAGVDHTIWNDVVTLLPDSLRIIRFDLRGHGQSDVPDGPYRMGTLVSDAEDVCAAHDVKDAVFIGHGVGGMVAQGLAVKRLDMIRALVLSNTAAKIGNKPHWERHVAEALSDGVAFAKAMAQKWRGTKPTSYDTHLATHFLRTNPNGYAGVCSAIVGTDFYTPTSGLRLPTLGIAGTRDGITPADLVKETVDLIPGSDFQVMRNTGHFPFLDDTHAFVALLQGFQNQIGHA